MNNTRLLRVAYSQYFCNISNISDEDLLNIHYIVNEKLSQDEDIEFWEDLHKDLIIWQPFENVIPSNIMDNIKNLIQNIEVFLLPDPNLYVTVNKIELVSDIAEYLTEQEFERLHQNFEIYEDNGDVRYTEEAQDYFNFEFSKITSIIENLE